MQVNLVVGDYFKARVHEATATLDAAQHIVRWFNNHSRARALFNKRQAESYDRTPLSTRAPGQKRSLSLFLPVATRWIAQYAFVTRLLEVGSVLRSMASNDEDEVALLDAAGSRAEDRSKAQEVINMVYDKKLWADLAR